MWFNFIAFASVIKSIRPPIFGRSIKRQFINCSSGTLRVCKIYELLIQLQFRSQTFKVSNNLNCTSNKRNLIVIYFFVVVRLDLFVFNSSLYFIWLLSFHRVSCSSFRCLSGRFSEQTNVSLPLVISCASSYFYETLFPSIIRPTWIRIYYVDQSAFFDCSFNISLVIKRLIRLDSKFKMDLLLETCWRKTSLFMVSP